MAIKFLYNQYLDRSIVSLVFVFLWINIGFSQEDTKRILFIGNSYTFVNHMPEMVQKMADERFGEGAVEIEMSVISGGELKDHWRKGAALAKIREGNWDYVVLQEQSALGGGENWEGGLYLNEPDRFWSDVRRFDAEIKSAGGKTALLMTWPRAWALNQLISLNYAYTTIGKDIGAVVIPAGVVWQKAREECQELRLYKGDQSHPKPAGSYLVATTVFTYLFNENPLGLSAEITGRRTANHGKILDESGVLARVSRVNAEWIQNAAWQQKLMTDQNGGYLKVIHSTQSYFPRPENKDHWAFGKRLTMAKLDRYKKVAAGGIVFVFLILGGFYWRKRKNMI